MNFKQVLLNRKWDFDPNPPVTTVEVSTLQLLGVGENFRFLSVI